MELYKLEEVSLHKYYKIPKTLYDNRCYRYALTADAKIIYTILLDRMELSRKNNWVNDNGEIYLLYKKEDIANLLGISLKTVYTAFAALEECKLIKQERQGLNMPNKIYIGKIDGNFEAIKNPNLFRICKICSSGTVKFTGQDMQNLHCIYTDFNETNISKTNIYMKLEQFHAENEFLDIYLEEHKRILGKKHVRVTEEQKDRIFNLFNELEGEVNPEEFRDKVQEYFYNLPENNNGNILAFLPAIRRFFIELVI